MKVKLLLSCALLSNLLTLGTIFGAGHKSASMHHMDDLYKDRRQTEARISSYHANALEKDQKGFDAVNQYQQEFLSDLKQNNNSRGAQSFLEQYLGYLGRVNTN